VPLFSPTQAKANKIKEMLLIKKISKTFINPSIFKNIEDHNMAEIKKH